MTDHHRARMLDERAKFVARKVAYKAKREIKKDFCDFLRFWWVELMVVAVFNIHMQHVVSVAAGFWPW